MQRYDIINALIKKYDYKSYLEIGVQNRENCFKKIQCNIKICVDPDKNAKADYLLTSDEYFNMNKNKFDIIFIDGLHHSEQVMKDMLNALNCLHDNGSIVVHDCNPKERIHQVVPRISRVWNGDCWRAWVQLRAKRDDLDMFVVDTDYGCGVIQQGAQLSPLYLKNIDLTYESFSKERKTWLNLISIEDFTNFLER